MMAEKLEYSAYKQYLLAGERVLWQGCPEKGNLVTKADIFTIPFSIMWCGFAIFWETSVIISDAPFFFKLWGIPFVCAGLYLVFGRFLWTAWMRKRTYYVITSKKIIRFRGSRVDMLDGKSMPPVHTEIHRNGNATVRFGMPNPYYARRRGVVSMGSWQNSEDFVLENIANLAQVQQAIENMEK